MSTFKQDIHFTLRLIRNRPGLSCLITAALALGIGLNTAIFSVVNAVLLRAVPVSDPDRVVRLYAKSNRTGGTLGISYPEYLDWRNENKSFDGIAVMRAFSFMLTGSNHPEHLKGTGISASGFRVWGLKITLGRDFTNDDDRPEANRVVILSYAFWQRRFGSDPNILEKTLILDDQSYTIVGVLQATPINVLRYPDVWVTNAPLVDQTMMRRESRYYFPVARLNPSATQAQAQAEMETIAKRLALQYPDTNKDMGIRFVALVDQLTADGRQPLTLLIVASSLIFLLACVNVMVVFFGSTVERGKELSVRLALGATRPSLRRQLLVQALIFALLGSVAGISIAKLGLSIFLQRFPGAVLRFQETTIDITVVLFTAGLAMVATLVSMVLPAMYTSGLNITNELKGESGWLAIPKYRTLGRGSLILFQVAMASALSLVSGLLIKSFYEVTRVDLGFSPHQVLSFQISLPAARYREPERQSALFKAALEKLAGNPGMESISGISSLPLTSQGDVTGLQADGQSSLGVERLQVEDESVLPGFFRTMQIPVMQGRDFTESDRAGAPNVAILDDALAAKLWPGQTPIGKRIRLVDSADRNPPWREVIGVVREIKHFGPEAKVRWMQVYVPQYQQPTPVFSFVINTTASESVVKNSAEKAIHDLDSEVPVENFATLDDLLGNYVSGRKVSLFLLAGFASIGIGLGIMGIYGVVANSVIQRRREIAIRIALGASRLSMIVLITKLGILAALGGILIGSGIVISLKSVLASLLFGITALDPSVYLASGVALILLAFLASLIPAARLFGLNVQQILRQ